MKARVRAIIPYFDGNFPDGRERPRRLEYLKRCVGGLTGFANEVVIGVQNDPDAVSVRRQHPEVTVHFVQEPEPLFLPAQLCRDLASQPWPEELVYYTESDQILHVGDIDLGRIVLEDAGVYVAPQRLTRVPERLAHLPALIGSDMHMASIVRHRGIDYGLENFGTDDASDYGDGLYATTDRRAAYGAAFLGSAALFRKVKFSKAPSLPTEHTGGFDLLATEGVRALKTRDVFEFYVEHLSGEDFYERVYPPEHEGAPWLIRWSDTLDVLADGTGTYTVRQRA